MSNTPPSRLISLRWRLVLPIFGLALIMVIIIVYVFVSQASIGGGTSPVIAQLTGLILSSLAAGAVISTFIVLSWLVKRVNKVTRAAERLTDGDMTARTNMRPTDEVSRLGHALDAYADSVQTRQDELRVSMRRQRREIEHLTSVLEALHDGVVVQDLSGQVTFINETAKNLLDLPGGLRSAVEDGRIDALTHAITNTLGTALAPGLFALGEPRRFELNTADPDRARVLNVQAAAIMAINKQRIGTVLVLRDATDESRRERARELLLSRMQDEIGAPVDDAIIQGSVPDGMEEFTREIARRSVTLQKMLVEMRDLISSLPRSATRTDRPLNVDKLVYALINEWRSTATAANLTLEANIERPGLSVFGDERRLRWAIGNLIDNAVKYTPPGGKITLEVKGEDSKGMVRLRLLDTGVGIALEDQPNVFTRFYRGTPTTEGGRTIRVPGSGQGLTIAKEIIDSHGGRLSIKSTPHVGTAVYFTLPTTDQRLDTSLPRFGGSIDDETIQLT